MSECVCAVTAECSTDLSDHSRILIGRPHEESHHEERYIYLYILSPQCFLKAVRKCVRFKQALCLVPSSVTNLVVCSHKTVFENTTSPKEIGICLDVLC